jgi:glycopeptide antibiotics resistance protein
MFRRHPLLTVATLAYLAIVGFVTLGPVPTNGRSTFVELLVRVFQRFEPTRWLDFDAVELLLNVAMFVPLGLFLVLLLGRRAWWIGILFGVALTVVIEFVQQSLPSRVSDPRDLVANSVGAVLGVLLALILTAGKARRARLARTTPHTRPKPVASR